MNLKYYREKKGLTQSELAKRCRMSQAAICDIENGNVNPRIDSLIKISNAIGCSIKSLLVDPKEHSKQ